MGLGASFSLHKNDTHKATNDWGGGGLFLPNGWTDKARQMELFLSFIGVWCGMET